MEGIWEKFDQIIDDKANCQPVLDIWLNILSDSQSCQNLFKLFILISGTWRRLSQCERSSGRNSDSSRGRLGIEGKIFTPRPPEAAILSPLNAICGHITSTCFLSVRWNEPEIRKIRHIGQSHQSPTGFKRLRQDSQHSRIHDCVKACIFATQPSRSGSGMSFWTEGGKGQN